MARICWGFLALLLICGGCFGPPKLHGPKPSQSFAVSQPTSPAHSLDARLDWLTLAGIVVVALSAVLFFAGNKYGFGAAVAGGALIGLCVFVKAVAWVLPWAVGGFVLIALCALAYKLWVERRATRELVATVEATKGHLGEAAKQMLFGKDGEVKDIQSGSTESLVAAQAK